MGAAICRVAFFVHAHVHVCTYVDAYVWDDDDDENPNEEWRNECGIHPPLQFSALDAGRGSEEEEEDASEEDDEIFELSDVEEETAAGTGAMTGPQHHPHLWVSLQQDLSQLHGALAEVLRSQREGLAQRQEHAEEVQRELENLQKMCANLRRDQEVLQQQLYQVC